ncbi:MAG TPA: hypothetical protein VIK33_01745 [Anaerolineae bacterium]
MPSLIDRLRRMQNKPEPPKPTTPKPAESTPDASSPKPPAPPTPAQSAPKSADATLAGSTREASDYLRKVSDKMMKLAEDFALGRVNRVQFEQLYRHYVEERETIVRIVETQPGTPAWKGAVTAGESVLIKRKHASQPLGYAIYLNANSLPIRSVGDFRIDSALLVPMLSSFRSATAEIFGSGLKSSEIEGGRWLCFVPGVYTTLIVLFSIEPARLQLDMLEQLHRHFEKANQPVFEAGLPDPTRLVFPHAAAFE